MCSGWYGRRQLLTQSCQKGPTLSTPWFETPGRQTVKGSVSAALMHTVCGHSLQRPWEMNTLGKPALWGKHLSLPGVEGFLRFEIAGWKPGQSQVGGEVPVRTVGAQFWEMLLGMKSWPVTIRLHVRCPSSCPWEHSSGETGRRVWGKSW